MRFIKQVTTGPFRIDIEVPEDGRNVYYEVTFASTADGESVRWSTITSREIVFVGGSRIAFNNALRKFGAGLLNITNLETGKLVVGAKS